MFIAFESTIIILASIQAILSGINIINQFLFSLTVLLGILVVIFCVRENKDLARVQQLGVHLLLIGSLRKHNKPYLSLMRLFS